MQYKSFGGKMHIYLAGPMRGIPYFNFPKFHNWAAYLRNLGHTVFNPAEHDEQKYGNQISNSPSGDFKDIAKYGFDIREVLCADLIWICKTADAICLLDGWRASKGANAEYAVARALALPVYFETDFK